MQALWRVRLNLATAWVLSCVIGWVVRWLALQIAGGAFTGTEDLYQFHLYSTIEAVSRMSQGAFFFLIVGLRRLNELFKA